MIEKILNLFPQYRKAIASLEVSNRRADKYYQDLIISSGENRQLRERVVQLQPTPKLKERYASILGIPVR